MCNKLVCMTILVLMIGLVSNASATAPVGWWEFDEGDGNTAVDSSGNGHHGTISENISWVPGFLGPYALDFAGGVVLIPDAAELRPSTVTACAWINLSGSQEGGARVLQKGNDNHETYVFQGGGYGMNFTMLDSGLSGHGISLARPLWQGEWIHLAGTYDGNEMVIYVNGEPNNSMVAGSFTPFQSVGEALHIGARNDSGDRPLYGMIDDVRVYNTALSAVGIRHIYWVGRDPNYAENPTPEDEAEDVFPDVVLSWTAGFDAASHDVYFGTNFNDVNDANTTVDPNNVYMGNQGVEDVNYDPSPAGLLEFGITCYWRIDEVNGPSVYTGDVWSFTVDDGKARDASPGNNELCIPADANLGWTAGVLATSHDVYFGSTLSDVNDSATPVSAGQAETSYEPGPLEENTTYYWRVDEHGATTYAKGNIWNFRTVSKLCLKVDLALAQCWPPYNIIPGTAKPGWWPFVVRGTDMYMHDAAWERGENGQGPPPDTNGIAGSGVHVAITCGSEGNGGFHVHGMCRDNLGGGGCPTGAPDGDPIANGWFHNIDWGGEMTGDVLMRINSLPPGEYVFISYHNHWEPCSQGTRNCLNCTSRMPNMPRVSAQSLPTDSLGYNFGFQLGTGMGVTPLQDACDVDVSCVTSDDDVTTSTISFHTDGSDVLVIYDGGDNTYPDPARPGREGSKGILNAFQIALIRGDETAWRPSPRDGAEDIPPN
ncbi:MAG: LamG domain-containing protein, partial [Planctomycetota bacterium]